MSKTVAMQDVFGNSTTPKTLTASFVADTKAVMYFKYFKKMNLGALFTPGTTGEFALIQVETSAYDGTTNPPEASFRVYSDYRQPDANPGTELDVFGVPFAVPKDVASPTSATAYYRSLVIEDLTCNWIRIKAKSSGSSGFGTLYVNVESME